MLPTVRIYTDGGCWPNPGPGGWAAILMFPDDRVITISGGCPETSNNQMEITAAIKALMELDQPHVVTINTDSLYLKRGFTEWLPDWIARGWRTASKKPVKNIDLWMKLMNVARGHDITWYHVPGHSGNVYNEEADRLATKAREAIAEKENGGE